jgi:hypothetical protein
MLNLKDACGKRYRIYIDLSHQVERSEFKTDGAEPWYYELHSTSSYLYPYDETVFCVLWTGAGTKALKALSLRHKRLDGEVLYFFVNSALQSVLSAVRFNKKRQVTDAMREAGKRLATKYGFKSHK